MVSLKKIKISLPRLKTYKGRHIVSFWAAKIFEKSGIKNLFGVNLVAAVFVAGVVTPEATNMLNLMSVEQNVSTPISAETKTLTTFEMPLTTFAISQLFSFWHPGIDMTSALGSPVYAIESGIVEFADSSFFGYGKHVIVAHERTIKSLSAHLSEISVTPGQKVARGELIGKVGSTGWSTGNHLHLEIYENGTAINPMEVLPIKPAEVHFDRVTLELTSKPASSAATIVISP